MTKAKEKVVGLGRYEFTDDGSNKFWACVPNDDGSGTYVTSWGKIGSKPQEKVVDEATAQRKINEKLNAGYRLVKAWDGGRAAPTRATTDTKETPATTFGHAMAAMAAAEKETSLSVVPSTTSIKIAGVSIEPREASDEMSHLVPSQDDAYFFQKFTSDVVKDAIEKRPVLLIGHTGSGKTSLVEQLAARLNQPVMRVNLNQQTSVSDFVGYWGVKAGETVWTDGALPWCMRNGVWLIVDELDYGEPAILSVLNSVLERKGRLLLKEKGGEIVSPHENFRIFGTGNAIGSFSEFRHLYQGTNLLNEAFLDRWKCYIVDYMPEGEEAKVLSAKVKQLSVENCTALVKVAASVRKAFIEETVQCTFSTRRLIDWAEMIVRHRALGKEAAFRAAESTIYAKISREDAMTIEGIMKRSLLGKE